MHVITSADDTAIAFFRSGMGPDARVRILPGRQHIAMYTDPDMFVAEIVQFLAY